MDLTKFAADLFLSVREWAQPAFDALSERIETLEKHFSSELDTRLGEIKTLSEDDVRALVEPLVPEQKEIDLAELVKSVAEEIPNHIPEPIEGPQGEKGEAGERGEAGEKGEPGESIDPETVREMVAEAVNEAVSKMEKPKDGKDALQIEILPEIDPEKSYTRGTYAMHRGGLWRAHQKTSGEHGWECVVNGIHDIEVAQRDERHIEIKRITSTGSEESTITIPALIYRGTWADKEYQPGDTVTSRGSLWHCNKATTDKPGTSDAWTLAAKKGRDGRDVVRTANEDDDDAS